MFVETRDDSRDFFLQVWGKMAGNVAMDPLEKLIAQVIIEHPEYHAMLADPARARELEFDGPDPRPNPFLHMGLHIALVEQLQTDRPSGIRTSYQELLKNCHEDRHAIEHRMLECLAEALWQAGQNGTMPDEVAYLESIKQLLL